MLEAENRDGPDHPDVRLCRVARRRDWHIYHRLPGGRRHRVSTGTADKVEAEAALRAYVAELSAPPGRAAITVADILDRYLAERAERGIPGLERLKYTHKALARHLGQYKPEHLDRDVMKLYAARRKRDRAGATAKGASPGTIRTEWIALGTALRWAQEKHDPPLIARVPKLGEPPAKAPPRERSLTAEEMAALLDAARPLPHLHTFCMMAYHTGRRHEAIVSLPWTQVDFERRLIDFRRPGMAETKKRRGRVAMSEALFAELQEARDRAATPYVIEFGGAAVRSVKHAFAGAVRRAELKGRVTPHTLKHTCGTRLAALGMSPWEIARFLDTTLATVERSYVHLDEESTRRVAEALG